MPSASRAVVADVDLDTLAVSYRDVRRPAAIAKIVTGWHRQAVALGDGRLAVAGSNYDRTRRDPAGLQLIDVQTGNDATARGTRELRARRRAAGCSSPATPAKETATGPGWVSPRTRSTATSSGMCWTASRWGGSKLPAATPTSREPDAYPPTVRVIDLADGSVRTVRGQLPLFVT